MRLRERHSLPLSQADAWAALHDLGVLQHALPGCESLLEIAPEEFVGEMVIALGPVTSRFTIYVHRRDIEAPRHCTLHFETRLPDAGAGGRGSAALYLSSDDDDATTLRVDVTVQVEGLAARLSEPLIDVVVRKMAGLFFDRLRAQAIAGA